MNYSANKFSELGYCNFKKIFNSQKCKELSKKIFNLRKLNKNIFYSSEAEFKKKGRYYNYSPGVDAHNLLISPDLDFNLDFIERSKNFVANVESIMGKNYSIMKKSIIRSVPYNILPTWLKKKLIDVGRPNLNPWIRDEHQDIQYFLNVDFHQDMTRGNKFCTFYIYLDDVREQDSPLRLLEGSHKLGATPYPHYIRKSNFHPSFNFKNKLWYYNDLHGNQVVCKEAILTGRAGSMYCFHGLTLHGSYYNFNKSPRISLRYLIKSNNKNSPFQKSFKLIKSPLVIKNIKFARLDRDKDGSFKRTGMLIGS
jgi:hypothetical protein